MVKIPEKMEKFVSTLRRQERFTVRETNIVGKLVNLANSRPNQQVLEKMQGLVRELKRVEWREYFMASASKLHSRMKKMLKLPMFSPTTRSKLVSLVKQIEIFYGKMMVDTVNGLGKELKSKRINWKEVREKVSNLQTDIRALTAVERGAGEIVRVK